MLKKLKFSKLKYCVEILDYIDNPPTIIMEFCEGGDLRKVIDSNKNLPINDKIEIIIQILKGLKMLHRVGIIHGDLKAMNIFLSNKYERNKMHSNIVKLGDFGLSDQNVIKGGTRGFMAPEIFKTGGSFASDIYSIGKVMLEVITCLPMRTIGDINSNNISNYSKYIPNFSGSNTFVSIIKQCLIEDPNRRPTATQLNNNFWKEVLVKYDYKYKKILLKKEKEIKKIKEIKHFKNNEKGFINCHEHPLTFHKINWEKICWICEICFIEFPIEERGFYCQICHDYYICSTCYIKNEIGKQKVNNDDYRNKKNEKAGLFTIKEEYNLTEDELKKSNKSKNNNMRVKRDSIKKTENNKTIVSKQQKRSIINTIKDKLDCNCSTCCYKRLVPIIFFIVFGLAILFGLYYLIKTIISYSISKKQ